MVSGEAADEVQFSVCICPIQENFVLKEAGREGRQIWLTKPHTMAAEKNGHWFQAQLCNQWAGLTFGQLLPLYLFGSHEEKLERIPAGLPRDIIRLRSNAC